VYGDKILHDQAYNIAQRSRKDKKMTCLPAGRRKFWLIYDDYIIEPAEGWFIPYEEVIYMGGTSLSPSVGEKLGCAKKAWLEMYEPSKNVYSTCIKGVEAERAKVAQAETEIDQYTPSAKTHEKDSPTVAEHLAQGVNNLADYPKQIDQKVRDAEQGKD
jgi:hypothetical protein